jgi:hypothetical protein
MSIVERAWILFALAFCIGCSAGHYPESAEYLLNSEIVRDAEDRNLERTNGKLDRKLIYTARVKLETSDLDQFAKALVQQVELFDGVLTNYQDERTSGDLRSGMWTLRVPSGQFDAALQWLDSSANLVSKQVKSQDITEEFVDLEARLQNKRNTEQRLKTLLDERPGKLDEILSVERELDRVREEIERVEGRFRFVKDQLALSTIEIMASTRVEYVSKDVGLGQRAKEAWEGSILEIQNSSTNLLVAFIGWIPRLPILLGVMLLGWWSLRCVYRKLIAVSAAEPIKAGKS